MNLAFFIKRHVTLIACLLGVPLAAGIGYYFIKPKAIVSNTSSTSFAEFVISLPSSRISFSPIEAGSSSTIFYSRQNQAGTGSYSLMDANGDVTTDNFSYAEGSELGRVLRFTIDTNGRVILDD